MQKCLKCFSYVCCFGRRCQTLTQQRKRSINGLQIMIIGKKRPRKMFVMQSNLDARSLSLIIEIFCRPSRALNPSQRNILQFHKRSEPVSYYQFHLHLSFLSLTGKTTDRYIRMQSTQTNRSAAYHLHNLTFVMR